MGEAVRRVGAARSAMLEPDVNVQGARAAPACPIWALRRADPPHQRPRSLAPSPPTSGTWGGRLVVPQPRRHPRLASEQETAVKGVIIIEIRYYLSPTVNQYQRAHAHQGRGQEDGFDLMIERCGVLPTPEPAQGDARKTQQGEIMRAQRDRDQDEDGPGVLKQCRIPGPGQVPLARGAGQDQQPEKRKNNAEIEPDAQHQHRRSEDCGDRCH